MNIEQTDRAHVERLIDVIDPLTRILEQLLATSYRRTMKARRPGSSLSTTLTHREARMLDYIDGWGKHGINHIAMVSGIHRNNVSVLIIKLEQLGLVVRKENARREIERFDRNSPRFSFRLTPAGKGVREIVLRSWSTAVAEIVSVLPDSRREREAFISIAEKLVEKLNTSELHIVPESSVAAEEHAT